MLILAISLMSLSVTLWLLIKIKQIMQNRKRFYHYQKHKTCSDYDEEKFECKHLIADLVDYKCPNGCKYFSYGDISLQFPKTLLLEFVCFFVPLTLAFIAIIIEL